ncbi:30S ribosomal protein S7 [Candidatus Woesebacteria bacterium]|nr:MAG: 30S ribosomal protein S7 [Candidatus Woesebacteria bacterium]
MSRRGKIRLNKILPDSVYNNRLVTKLINRTMKDGKKSVAQKQVYRAMDLLKEKEGDPIKTFSKAMENIKPVMEVRARRVGGAAYQVPMPVRGSRKETLAVRWLVAAARARSNSDYHTFTEKLAAEILDASNGEGGAVKKNQDTQRMADANRAFAHFRW